jgi:hypothetical protein
MNVGLVSLQSSLINYSARQHVFKPIVYLVAAIALGIISALVIGKALSRTRVSSRNQQPYTRLPPLINIHREDHWELDGHTYRTYPTVKNLEVKPCEYIQSLAGAIRSVGLDMNFEASFRNADGSLGEAYDAGGPTRQFFNLLFQSLKNQFSSEETKFADFYPHTKKSGTLLVPQGKPTNNPKTSIFYDIGTVMAYVYFSYRSPLIGPVFHESIFAAILCLDDREIDTPFAQLSDATKFKICKALINTQQASGEHLNAYLEPLALLEKGEQATDAEINSEQILHFYASAAFEATGDGPRDRFILPGGDEVTLEGVQFNMDAIRNDKRGFLHNYFNYLLQQKTDSLGTIELILFPIHTIAKGLKEASKERWANIRSLSVPSTDVASSETVDPQIETVKRLQRKIQGVLDREVLVSKIISRSTIPVVNQQSDWIKAWILDPATSDALIEGLLTFWTGSSYIDWEKVAGISISADNEGLLPTASTCSYVLKVSNCKSQRNTRGELGPLHNHTKEGYDQVLNKIAGEYSSVYTHC